VSECLKNVIRDFTLFCRVDRQLSKVTIKGYRQHIERFFKEVDKHPQQITTNDIRKYLSIILEAYEKPYTYADILRSFKVFFRDYLNRSFLVESFKFPKIPFYPKQVPSKEDLQRFYYAIPDLKGKSMFLLFATSGLRRNELLTLLQDNIDINNRMMIPTIHYWNYKENMVHVLQ